MTNTQSPLISIILPTRGRPDQLRLLLESFQEHTEDLDKIEVILVVDSDDTQMANFEFPEFPLKRVVVEPGLKMGQLNMSGYEASIGEYIMLLNDDVIVRTPNWDKKVLSTFKSFSDEILLVHVNDALFEERLCTFPFLSRTYCKLAGGICQEDYVRYRIDDHIYNVFNLLSVLGTHRLVYLPDVIFEHSNFVLDDSKRPEYQPDPIIHELDTRRFEELLPERKALALRLLDYIEKCFRSDELRQRRDLLTPLTDSVALRRLEYVRFWPDRKLLSSANTRVMIGVVSANLSPSHPQKCIDHIKRFTKNYDLVILDNNHKSTFNHPYEMNRLLSICDTDFLVLMDDDVFVELGWLDGLLRCFTPSVGIVTPLHRNSQGEHSYAGVVMRPDHSGHHTHNLIRSQQPIRIQTICSAILLVDLRKCGHIRFDERYTKYFLDIDYGLRVWQSGFEVVCSPYSNVTHIGGGTLEQGSSRSNELFEVDRQHFVKTWIEFGQYRRLVEGIWQTIPEIKELIDNPDKFSQLLERQPARIAGRLNDAAGDNTSGFLRRPFRAWHALQTERSRIGSWKRAIRSLGKPFLKERIVSRYGAESFLQLKGMYQRRAWFSVMWFGTRLVIGCACNRILRSVRILCR